MRLNIDEITCSFWWKVYILTKNKVTKKGGGRLEDNCLRRAVWGCLARNVPPKSEHRKQLYLPDLRAVDFRVWSLQNSIIRKFNLSIL
jgi:hypothetical protein